MPTKNKPQMIQHVLFEGRIVGAVMLDSNGYFYRPKRNSLVKSSHNPEWDGEHKSSVKEILKLVWGE